MKVKKVRRNQKLRLTNYYSLAEAFGINAGGIISLVGAGGKTTLMFALAREMSSAGNFVITTTTTKIFEPAPSQTEKLVLETDESKMIDWLFKNKGNYSHVTLAREKLTSGKLDGITPGLVCRLSKLVPEARIIVEADGAARRPLKAPNATEPVIPEETSLLIAVVGLDAVGRPLNEENVFRSEIASRLLGVPIGTLVTAELVAALVTHPQGITRGAPEKAKIIPFINKADLGNDLRLAIDTARKILETGYPRVKQVVAGQASEPAAGLLSITVPGFS